MKPITITPNGCVLGPDNSQAKMTYEKVKELRRLRQQFGVSYCALGAMFDIEQKTARSIASGKTWAPTATKIVFRADNEELERIRSLVADGVGVQKIATILGVTKRSVDKVMQSNGIRSNNKPFGGRQPKKQTKE